MIFSSIFLYIVWCYLTKSYLAYAKTPFNQNLLKDCPSIADPKFVPTLFLPIGILQTWMAGKHVEDDQLLQKHLDQVDLPYGGVVGLEHISFKSAVKVRNTENKIMVVILPGLTASSSASYVIGLANNLLRQGYNVVVYLSRFNGRKFTFSDESSIDLVKDLNHAMGHLKTKFPNFTFMAVGHSYGANQLVNYLGTCCEQNIFKAAVSLANPLNMILSEGKIRNTICDKIMTQNIHEVIALSMETILNGPKSLQLNVSEIVETKTLRAFDNQFTCKIFGFNGADEYYWATSSIRRLGSVKIPLLLINAMDDPVVSEKGYPLEDIEKINQNVIMIVTNAGGHLGWFTGLHPKRWYLNPTIEFLNFAETN